MGVFSRFERKLESGVGNAFARMFKGKVHPAEIARALQQDADANRTEIAPGRVLVPNRYVVRLGPSDYDHLHEWEKQLSRSLADMAREQFDDEGWSTYGAIKISFTRDESLRTGVFDIESGVDNAPDSVPPSAPAPPPRQTAAQPAGQPAAAGGPALPPVPPPPPVGLAQPTRHLGTYAPPPAPAPQRPAAPALKHTIVIDGPGTRFEIGEGSSTIGRGSTATVRVTDNGISREHAQINVRGPIAVIRDLNSTNGTLVNGRRVSEMTLRHGDVIRLGRSVLVYRYESGDAR
ncbi:DUF3662 domain-containing protein [Epidermidibacterium keratini]|uniref:DUF3662 domain-containing protein n=1 Tax=Epidermidibacterium keratini TaxID=1891644 RepID=A0A7L4YNG8_9ACTN|nr:DUF3662 and FHA domain-containing protein [Epidermidibacterium keratini]QHC00433.1 DUF3662 domain-containing protein [Epidermidibacterium keratini]